jgi:tetratricopeptide (TPR) repeat protein
MSLKKVICISIILVIAASLSSLVAQQQVRNGKMAVTSAKIRLKYKKYDEALEILEEGKRVEPDYPELYPLLGGLYVRNGQYAKADSAFKKAVMLEPKLQQDVKEERLSEWSALVNRGVKAMKEEDYTQSITHFTNATIIYPEGVEAYINLAASLNNSGQVRESVKPFQTARMIDPTNFNVLVDLAKVYENLSRPDSAKIYYKDAQTVDPENQTVKEALAACYLREGSIDSASAMYDILLQGDEVNPNVAFNAGLVQFQRQNWAGAEKAFNIVVENSPEDMEGLENLSIALMQQEKYEEVIPYLEKIVELDKTKKEAWGSLVVAYAQIGMNDKADEAHKKYQELGGE